MANVSLLPTSLQDASAGNSVDIQSLKESLANILADTFRDEFKAVHLSGQLLRSIKVTRDDVGNYMVEIPPQIYDIAYYRRYKVIKTVSSDSYAIDVNLTGGFSGLHKDYVSRCLSNAISRWAMNNNLKTEIKAAVN